MTDEQKREALHEMFQSQGWEILKEQLKDQEKAVDTLGSVSDEKTLYFNKGRLFEIKQYLNLPDLIRQALDESNVV